MKTILATAYGIDPYKGSESATGWNFVFQIARFNKVIAITRKNNQTNIEKYIKENNIDTTNLSFAYYDLPYYLRFWKRGSKGALLYFYLWQMFLPLFVKKQKIKFDITHNINFHSDWTPSFLWVLKKPFVWGPINHNEKTPFSYLIKSSSVSEAIIERLKWVMKLFYWFIDPFLFLTKKKATIIIAGHSKVSKRLNLKNKKVTILSQVGTEMPNNHQIEKENKFEVIFIGRFIPIKQIDIVIESFNLFYERYITKEKVQLTILGAGPLEQKLLKLHNKNIPVVFKSWIDKKDIWQLYKAADVFFFPSHEGAGMVIPEALSYGLPVICFNNYGPGELVDDSCAIRIPYTSYKESVSEFADALWNLYSNKELYASLSKGALEKFKTTYTWDRKGEILAKIYEQI